MTLKRKAASQRICRGILQDYFDRRCDVCARDLLRTVDADRQRTGGIDGRIVRQGGREKQHQQR